RRAPLTGAVAPVVAAAVTGAVLTGPGALLTDPADGPQSEISDTYMRDTLLSLLPTGQTSAAQGIGRSRGSTLRPSATVRFDTGHGAGQINLLTEHVAVPLTADTAGTQCADPFETPTESCARTVRTDGSVLVTNVLLPRAQGMPKELVVVDTRADGTQVRVEAYSPEGGTAVPLTVDQAVAVATSSAWAHLADGMRPTSVPATHAAVPAAADLRAEAVRLLPAGAAAESADAPQQPPGATHLKVTVGGASSWLTVRVSPKWSPEGGGDPRKSFESNARGTLSHTADGSSVVVRQTGRTKEATGAGSGATIQTAIEVLHPDGTLVWVSEQNGPNGYTFEPGTPALTVDQLTAVATASVWRRG
ncbi:hypothetical protein ACFQMG_03290, partial [Kitasatospora paranensis]